MRVALWWADGKIEAREIDSKAVRLHIIDPEEKSHTFVARAAPASNGQDVFIEVPDRSRHDNR